MGRYRIELSSSYDGWSRYGVRLICEEMDSYGERTGMRATSVQRGGVSVLASGECTYIRILAYIIPEEFPLDRKVGRTPEFESLLRVECDGRVIASELLSVNVWGGISCECEFDCAGRI